jgi:hypothetical protein
MMFVSAAAVIPAAIFSRIGSIDFSQYPLLNLMLQARVLDIYIVDEMV